MRRKKSFVLLEILIGFALVSALILPFLRFPFSQMQQELDMLFQMQLTRHAQERLCEIEREIYQHQMQAKYLFDTENPTHKLPETLEIIELPFGWKRTYSEGVKLEWTAQRKSNEGLYSLVHIHLTYKKKEKNIATFHTELIAQKKL